MKWQELVNTLPDKKFCLFGNSLYDDPSFIEGDNVTSVFDQPFEVVANIMLKSKEGLISVVTGISHLAFHLGVKNILLTNQNMTWGNNPEAVMIKENITFLTTDNLIENITKD